MNLNLKIDRYDGYIFDCDGTLADSMPAHYRAWLFALEKCGARFTFDEEMFYGLGGMPTPKIVSLLNERYGCALDPATVAAAKEEGYLLAIDEIPPITAMVDLARRAAANSKGIAVASGGLRRVVLRTLESIGLGGFFPVIVTAEDVERHKPHPDIFLTAARRIGAAPDRCLVLEDSPLGEAAATAAGMDCLLIPRKTPDREEFEQKSRST